MEVFNGWVIKFAIVAAIVSMWVVGYHNTDFFMKTVIAEIIILVIGMMANNAGHNGIVAACAVAAVVTVPAVVFIPIGAHMTYSCLTDCYNGECVSPTHV
jgi:hypothetical protein